VAHVFHFFLPGGEPGTRGVVRRVCDQDARRMERVLRLRPGDEVDVADPEGTIWLARVVGGGEVELLEQLHAPRPAPPLVVRLALTGPRSDTAIEKLVELGVEEITPLETAAIKREPRTVRWQRIAEAAACQAKRPRIPRIGETVRLQDALAPGAVLLSHEEPDGTLDDALAKAGRPLALLIGPEAGFTAAEHEAARRAGVPIATLGDLVLRTETAAIAAAVLALDRLGALAPA
jgi:16S rRNA (uracil1498-N3)-methyltransferase